MAEDDKDPGIDASNEGHRELFVDRDDDNRSPFVDNDYGDDFPGSDNEPEDVDPGYAAFASELDDPLADWPSPDAPLEDLPEMRQQKEALYHRPASQAGEPESGPNLDSNSTPERPDETYKEALSSFNTDERSDGLLFDEADDGVDASAADAVDGDDLSADDSYDTFQSLVDDRELPEVVVPNSPSDDVIADTSSSIASYDEPDLPADDFLLDDEDLEAPLPEENAVVDEGYARFEEEFVDDFLNDLDPPEEDELPAVDDLEDDFENDFDTPLGATANIATSSVERAAAYEAPNMSESDTKEESPPSARLAQNTAQEQEGDSRAFPLGMIAVVAIALILLGIGGYGVMQQRGDMQAEIRNLQAKLATTISPEEAEMEREGQRQVQLQNESLSTEIEALTAENDALAQQLAELEAVQAAQISAAAEKRAQEEAAANAAAERATQQAAAKRQAAQPSSARSTGNAVAGKGPWFVNFGSYADRTIAERWSKKLMVDSGEVVVQTATAAARTLYRVRVIGLPSQDAAERVATALERQYQLPRLWVGKN